MPTLLGAVCLYHEVCAVQMTNTFCRVEVACCLHLQGFCSPFMPASLRMYVVQLVDSY